MGRLFIAFLLTLIIGCQKPERQQSGVSMKLMDENWIREDSNARKVVIYQMMTRLFGNKKQVNAIYGTIEENGVGKFSDINDAALISLFKLGITHIWYTGIIEHAVLTDYREYGIFLDDADVVKGRAGSPYAIKDYYDVNPDLADQVDNRMVEFEALVSRTHEHGMKVIIDFVPNHVARKYQSDVKPSGVRDLGEDDDTSQFFSENNNFYYLPGTTFQVPEGYIPLGKDHSHSTKDGMFKESPAKASGNNVFKPQPNINDWFETVKLNYGIHFRDSERKYFDPPPSTWTKMRDILLFWAEKEVDGFRCDMAEMVPVEFWEWVIPQIKARNPEIVFIAEIYNPDEYKNYLFRGGFDFLYDKVQMYDTLKHIIRNQNGTGDISVILKELEGINNKMLRFLENHDEQRIASSFFAESPRKALPAMTVSSLLSGGPIMIYFGQEVGEKGEGIAGFSKEDGRTTIYDYWGVPAHQRWMNGGIFDGGALDDEEKELRQYYSTLLNLSKDNQTIASGNLFDLYSYNQSLGKEIPSDIYYFLRFDKKQSLLVITNFSEVKNKIIEISLPPKVGDFHILGPEGLTSMDELISGKKIEVSLDSEDPVMELDLDPLESNVIAWNIN